MPTATVQWPLGLAAGQLSGGFREPRRCFAPAQSILRFRAVLRASPGPLSTPPEVDDLDAGLTAPAKRNPVLGRPAYNASFTAIQQALAFTLRTRQVTPFHPALTLGPLPARTMCAGRVLWAAKDEDAEEPTEFHWAAPSSDLSVR